jgi:hypothetical protein
LVGGGGSMRTRGSDFGHGEDGDLHAVGDAMDYDEARDATAQHAGRRNKREAKPAGGIEPAMAMEDGDDVPAQVSEGRPLCEFPVDTGHHSHLDQATANSTCKTPCNANYRK